MKGAEELLGESLDQYKAILERMYAVQKATKDVDPAQMKVLSQAIDSAQEELRKIEQELALHLQQRPELQETPLFHKRLAVMEEILELTKQFTPKIKSLMAINRNELKKVAGGITVMTTYNGATHYRRKGGLINRLG